MNKPLCEICDEKWATHVIDRDLGDHDGQATVVYGVACDGCKDQSSYLTPEPITDRWLRYFRRPWDFYSAPHAEKETA